MKHVVIVEGLGVVDRGVLTAGVAVMDEADIGAGLALTERHSQRVEHEVAAPCGSRTATDDPPAVGVDHEAEEHEALPAAQVGEVRGPFLVRAVGSELTLDRGFCLKRMKGFEPSTFAMARRRSSQLSYIRAVRPF